MRDYAALLLRQEPTALEAAAFLVVALQAAALEMAPLQAAAESVEECNLVASLQSVAQVVLWNVDEVGIEA